MRVRRKKRTKRLIVLLSLLLLGIVGFRNILPNLGDVFQYHHVASGEYERGIVMCGTGIGVSITANKVKGIRCALCSDPLSARLTREHNDTNMLAFGQRIIGSELAKEIVNVWLTTPFSNGERHKNRIEKVMAIEKL